MLFYLLLQTSRRQLWVLIVVCFCSAQHAQDKNIGVFLTWNMNIKSEILMVVMRYFFIEEPEYGVGHGISILGRRAFSEQSRNHDDQRKKERGIFRYSCKQTRGIKSIIHLQTPVFPSIAHSLPNIANSPILHNTNTNTALASQPPGHLLSVNNPALHKLPQPGKNMRALET